MKYEVYKQLKKDFSKTSQYNYIDFLMKMWVPFDYITINNWYKEKPKKVYITFPYPYLSIHEFSILTSKKMKAITTDMKKRKMKIN